MAIYKTREFARWARRQNLTDKQLFDAVQEMTKGLYETDLGGNLLKKRIARPGRGKSSGFRTLVVTNRGSLWFFVYGFAKNERSNIDVQEEAALKKLALVLLSLSPPAISKARSADELIEVRGNA